MYDLNNDGEISKEELKTVLSRRIASMGRGGRMPAGELDQLVDQFDINKDGVLDMQEFAEAFSQSDVLQMFAPAEQVPRHTPTWQELPHLRARSRRTPPPPPLASSDA